MNEPLLIVGADGGLGGTLVRYFASGRSVIKTTRRHEKRDDDTLFLELERQEDFVIPEQVTTAVVAAGVTGFERCQADPGADRINVEKTAALIARFLDVDLFTVYLSTSAVFADVCENPGELTPHSPGTAYGRQKSLCEKLVANHASSKGKENLLAIVRVTKVVMPDRPPLSNWLDNWNARTPVNAFVDLRTSPISPRYVARGLEKIIETRVSGFSHLSGAIGCSYFELCRRLAEYLGIDPALVGEAASANSNAKIYFSPASGVLDMTGTVRSTGIAPQSMEEFLHDCGDVLREQRIAGMTL